MDYHLFKIKVHQHCDTLIQNRIKTIEKNLSSLMQAKLLETKSSAGDKYETGMASLQNEEDLYKRQLANTQQIYTQFKKINGSKVNHIVEPGALIKLPVGWFYMGAALGKITIDNLDVYCISLRSPIGGALKNHKKDDKIYFNEQLFTIAELY